MNKKKNLDHEVVNIFEIYMNFKNNYLKVISIIFSCLVISILLAHFQSKKVQFTESKIVIRKPLVSVFASVDSFFTDKYFYNQQNIQVNDYFFNNLILNLSSKELLNTFFNKNEKLKEFKQNNKNYIKYLEINKNNKLDLNGRIIRDPIEFFFIYPTNENFNGNKFLNDFTNFAYKKTVNIFFEEIKDSINLEILKNKESLNYAIELNIQEPKSFFPSKQIFEDSKFLLGYKFLSLKINNLEKKLNTLKLANIKYDPIYEKAKIISNKENFFLRYVLVGLIAGFSMSFLLILFETINKKV